MVSRGHDNLPVQHDPDEMAAELCNTCVAVGDTLRTSARYAAKPPTALEAMFEGPLTWLLLRLAAPNLTPFGAILVLVSVDAFVVGQVGREALAGLSLVFPILMLSQSVAAGGLGSAVASAVARALGAQDRRRARSLALHGLLIAAAVSLTFAVVMTICARPLFVLMGGRDEVLSSATAYATVVFLGAPAPWLLNVAASIARGAGDMKRPAIGMGISAGVYVVLCPVLTLGLRGFEGLGIAGTGLAFVAAYTVGTLVILPSLFTSREGLQLRARDFVIEPSALHAIVTVGALGGTNAVLSSLTALAATGFIGNFSPAELAGYGLGIRLEYLVIPLSFAFGTALVTVVGANIGVGNFERARRAAWIGGGLACLLTGSIGALAAFFPYAWLQLFTADTEILQSGAIYLRNVGPYYGFFGLGLALYFASIGAGRPALPVVATILRLVIVTVGMSLAAHSLTAACTILAIAFAAYGVVIAVGTNFITWTPSKV